MFKRLPRDGGCATVSWMRWPLVCGLLAGLLLAALPGCRVSGGPTIDPTDPTALPACPPGRHLLVALRVRQSGNNAALLRFTPDLAPCAGISFTSDLGTPTAVGGLPDGRELVGFTGSYDSGSLVVFEGDLPALSVEDESYHPISMAVVDGASTLAVLWGTDSGGERLDLYRLPALEPLGSYDAAWENQSVSAALSGQPSRLALTQQGEGIQELRIDPGAASLATTGELQVGFPTNARASAVALVSGGAWAATSDGLSFWPLGQSHGFLGPTRCMWPATAETPLPDGEETYHSVAPVGDDAVTLVTGRLGEGGSETTLIYRMTRRGECELLFAVGDTHRGVALAWSGG